ncbi:high-temperature-induced dauer-formation protein-domain-containing protein [Mycena amicta]|nr:high-temperature-induced dauer-formation protein-domain-containing protein [Mycena amicta]
MFKQLSAPFRLPDADKLGFRSSPGGIAKLAAVRSIPEADSYWNQYTVLFDSASDVFSLITPHDIRRALVEAPENVATLVRVITSRLSTLILDHTFPTPPNASVAAFASSFIQAGAGSSERNITTQVLNCLRILQRVLPVVFEVDAEVNAFEFDLFWRNEEVAEDGVETASETPQFVIEDEDDSDSAKKRKQLPSLGERLFGSLSELMFCCGFTIPTKMKVDHHKINYVIWETGIGSTLDPGPSHTFDSNKTEVLRLLLVLFSRQIYVSPAALFSKPSRYTAHVVQSSPRRDVLTILCSLLNTAMNSPQTTSTNLVGMAGKLPYNHLVFKGEDPRSNLVGMCLQVLCVLLDFQSGSARDRPIVSEDSNGSAPTARTNSFRYFLMKLHRTQDFTFVADGIMGILEQQMATMGNILPGAKKPVPYMNETGLAPLARFLLFSLITSHLTRFVFSFAPSSTFMPEVKTFSEQHGLCRALSYIVQTLSAEPAFGVRLTKPLKAQLNTKWNAPGTAADFIIHAIYSIVATTSGQLNSLYPALIIALSNSAPYFQNLTVTASTRLIQLFTSFSNPLFLLSDEGHPRLLFFMLEIFSAVILHNLRDNPNLVYGILSAHKTFEDLGTFTLSRGLREIRRVQLAKEEQARNAEVKGKGPRRAEHDSQAHAEKVKLLRTERETASPPDTSQEDSPRPSQGQESEPSMVLPASPTSETPPASEKVRGKMRERRSQSLDTNSSVDRVAAAGVGRNGFVPTQEWVTSWQQGLPLDAVMLLISELLPKVQEMQASRHRTTSTSAIVEYLGTISLQDILPPTPPITPRRFLWSDASIVWLTSLIWGEIYVRGMAPLGVWNATNVRLFYVKHAPSQQRQLTEAVSNVLGRWSTQGENRT